MLYLVRKLGESIIINDTIEVKVIEVKGRSVKLGFEFPSSATVLRKEIHDRVVQENVAAHISQLGAMDVTDAISGFGGASFNIGGIGEFSPQEASAESEVSAEEGAMHGGKSRLTLPRNREKESKRPPVPGHAPDNASPDAE